MNFLILGYGYTQGDVAFDASSPIKDAELTVNGAVLAYARSLDVWGCNGKFDAMLPFARTRRDGQGRRHAGGTARRRSGRSARSGFSVLWYGAPALTLEEFASYEADVIIGDQPGGDGCRWGSTIPRSS